MNLVTFRGLKHLSGFDKTENPTMFPTLFVTDGYSLPLPPFNPPPPPHGRLRRPFLTENLAVSGFRPDNLSVSGADNEREGETSYGLLLLCVIVREEEVGTPIFVPRCCSCFPHNVFSSLLLRACLCPAHWPSPPVVA
jgi:hypothetical protein